MRRTILTLVSSALLLAGAASAIASDSTALLNKQELQKVQQQQAQTQVVPMPVAIAPVGIAPVMMAPAPMQGPPPMQDVVTQQYGPQYRSYVPLEIKSDNPEITRTWDPTAHPGNASHLTPEGMACATDADCAGVMGCYNRADSGMIVKRLCVIPPGN